MSAALAVTGQRVPARLSQDLARALALAVDDPGALRHGVPASVKAEAAAALAALGPVRPAGARVVADWMLPLAASVRNPPDRADAEARAAAVATACADLPGTVFSQAAARLGMQRWLFWPSAAEVRTVLLESAAEALARRRALISVAAARVAEQPGRRAPPGPEEQAAVAAMVAKFVAEVTARASTRGGK